jgi:hypothetical protein
MGNLFPTGHPDSVTCDEPSIENLGASIVKIGMLMGAGLEDCCIKVGTTKRTHRTVIIRGKRVRRELLPNERNHDGEYIDANAVDVMRVLNDSGSSGMSGNGLARALGWKNASGRLYRLLNRLVESGMLVKRSFYIEPKWGGRLVDVRFILVVYAD